MELVKLGKKGQITIPKAVLRETGLTEEAPLMVEATADGSIVLRQVGVYPIELYTDQRIKEFEEENRITPAEHKRVQAFLEKKKKR